MGFYLFDPQTVLKKLPKENEEESTRILFSSFLEFLQETRGFNEDRIRHKRGKKFVIKAGAQLGNNNESIRVEDSVPDEDISEALLPTFDMVKGKNQLAITEAGCSGQNQKTLEDPGLTRKPSSKRIKRKPRRFDSF
ncbi:unnamed protein product [Psylliodes chrysocephalus]|uniref:Uncharacterized protein n=1 Tax=Psylliodes chrysocephalus TaxID=3402493 RepID=A0A9P0CFK6_9CUCU|nr:unnamed protein product [Psylliodes chrysocephala]